MASAELTIERAVAGGRMLARHEGRVVLVSGAIPGERVRVQFERATKQVSWARTIEVLEPSTDRRPAFCDPECGGAVYAHVDYARQRQLKAEVIVDAFKRIGKIPVSGVPDVAASPERGYRLRARLHVRGGRAGFFREGSHTLCDAERTGQIGHDALASVDAVLRVIGARASDLDSIVVSESIDGRARVLHLQPLAGRRLETMTIDVASVPGVAGVSAATVDGPMTLAGTPYITDSAPELFAGRSPFPAHATWRRHAASFFQANRFLVGDLVKHVLSQVHGDRCVDLYSGVGLFAVALAAAGQVVMAVEADAVSASDLAENARQFPERLAVERSTVEPFLARTRMKGVASVVLDPPRAGASPEALDALIQWGAPRVVYVSCDPPTLARDAARLSRAGYTLTSLRAFDLFPNTAHVETVAVFERADA